MAVIGAAVSAEIALFELLVKELTEGDRFARRQAADGIAKPASNRGRASLLVYLGVVDAALLPAIVQTFKMRNDIIHGNTRSPLSFTEAWSAINVARSLRDLLQNP